MPIILSHLFLLLHHSVQTDTDVAITHRIALKRKTRQTNMPFCYLTLLTNMRKLFSNSSMTKSSTVLEWRESIT